MTDEELETWKREATIDAPDISLRPSNRFLSIRILNLISALKTEREINRIAIQRLGEIGFNTSLYGEIRTAECVSSEELSQRARSALAEIEKLRGET